MADKKQHNSSVEPFIVWSRVPKKVIWAAVMLASFSLVPLGFVYAHRNLNWRQPRTSIIPDMDNQYRWNPQQYNPDFADGRVMRSWPEGTVAVGMLREDDHYYRGTVGEMFATDFPNEIIINDELISRGQDRYTIYCSPCHGQAGYGDGMIEKRAQQLAIAGPGTTSGTHRGLAWVAPLSYHSDEIRKRPVGHIFNTITNGIRTMPSYKSQIPVEDRWAIIAYIRSLQISQWTEVTDVDAQYRDNLVMQINAARSEKAAAPAIDPAAGSAVTDGTGPADAADTTGTSETADTENQADAVGGKG